MNLMRILSIGILTLTLLPTVLAGETSTTQEYRNACMKAFNISEKLSTVGTYKTRIQDCINDRIKADIDTERRVRLQVRTETVQQRLLQDSSLYIHRAVEEVPVQSIRFDNAQDGFLKLENNKPATDRKSLYQTMPSESTGYERYVPETSNPVNLRTTTAERQSRRLLKQNTQELSSTSSRVEAAHAYEQALRQALETCSDISSNFHRNNCIRSAMRKAGSR